MYHNDVPKIRNSFTHQPADTLEAVVRFVLATIQQQFHTVPAILDEWSALGYKAPTMWGMKKDGVKFMKRRKASIAAQLTEATTVEAIDVLLTVPGLNTVKAGFAAQLLGFQVGCLDLHNIRMYGVKPDSFKVTKKHTAKTRLAKIRSYVAMCEGLGGADQMWDRWCHVVADTQGKHFDFYAENVSALHTECIFAQFEQDKERW